MLWIRSQIKLKQDSIGVASLFLGIYYLWFFLPYMRTVFGGVYKYFFFAFFVIGLGILALENLRKNKFQLTIKHTIIAPILIYMAVMTFLTLFGSKDAGSHIRVSFTFWGTAFVYYLLDIDKERKRKFTIFLFVLIAVTLVTSSIGVILDSSAARKLANSVQTAENLAEDYALGKKNISSIYLFQGIAAFTPVFALLIRKKHIIAGSIGLLLSFIILLNASFTISLIAMLVGVLLVFLKRKDAFLNVALLILAFVVVCVLPWDIILSSLIDVVDNKYINSRLREVVSFLRFSSASGNLLARMEVYQTSIETFLNHPLGVGAYYFSDAAKNYVGTHSQILDDFARYGIFAVAFYAVFMKRYYDLVKSQWKKIQMQELAFPLVVTYVTLLILNIGFKSAEESVLMLFMLPQIPEMILHYKKERD